MRITVHVDPKPVGGPRRPGGPRSHPGIRRRPGSLGGQPVHDRFHEGSHQMAATATAQAGFPAAVEPVCEAVGSNGAILLPQSFNWASVVQTFRSWCGVPVAVARASDGPAEVLETAAEWEEAGRTLYLVTQDRESLEEFSAAPGGSVQTVPKVVNDRLAEASVTRLPMGYQSEELMFFLRRIDG